MSMPADTAEKSIRLLLVDDNGPSRMVQSYVIEDKFPEVAVTSCEQPPQLEEMLGYDVDPARKGVYLNKQGEPVSNEPPPEPTGDEPENRLLTSINNRVNGTNGRVPQGSEN